MYYLTVPDIIILTNGKVLKSKPRMDRCNGERDFQSLTAK
jgi:hypothetical protein